MLSGAFSGALRILLLSSELHKTGPGKRMKIKNKTTLPGVGREPGVTW